MRNYEDEVIAPESEQHHLLTIQDVLEVGFRHKKVLLMSFGGLVTLVMLYAFALPPKYQSETKILVQRERLDPIVSTEQQTPMMIRDEVSEEELNSEVELILSDDVLRRVVNSLSLDKAKNPGVPNPLSLITRWFASNDPKVRIARTVNELHKKLDVQPVKKSNIITITYQRRDREMVTKVLQALDTAYIDKHLEVHRPSGQYQFFEEKTNDYRAKLAKAEDQLLRFSQAPGAVKPELARDIALQKLSDFNANLHDTRALIAETRNRIHMLEQERTTIPDRMTTAARRLDNPALMNDLKSTLLNLELKRTELLTKFQPDYRPVQELEQEINRTKAAIAVESGAPLRDDTTDANPTYEWVKTELAKATADLRGLEARAAATEKNIGEYQAVTHDLQNKQITADDLNRDVKAAEENYLLYLHKREEARIADALDKTRILNVTIAEPATEPMFPTPSPLLIAIAGIFAAAILSTGLVFTINFLDSSLHNAREVEMMLNLPVLAAVPHFENVQTPSN